MPQQNPEAWRPVFFILIVLFWILTTPENSDVFSDPDAHAARRERQNSAFSVLRSSAWGDFAPRLDSVENATALKYVNLTGFRQQDGFAWEKLNLIRHRCHELTNNAKIVREGQDLGLFLVEPIWQNASGIARGPWVRSHLSTVKAPIDYNLTSIAPHFDWILPQEQWLKNVTGSEGTVMLKIDDAGPLDQIEQLSSDGKALPGGKIRKARVMVSLEDTIGTGDTHDIIAHGVHWVHEGTMLFSTTSNKFDGIFGLPHLAPSSDFYGPSQKLLNHTLQRISQANVREKGDPYLFQLLSSVGGSSDDPWRGRPHCEYIVYAQIHSIQPRKLGVVSTVPASSGAASIIEFMENELDNPTGAPIPSIPALQMSAIIYSPDCGFVVESRGPPESTDGRHLMGLKDEMLHYHINIWFYGVALVVLTQLLLTKNQSRESYTPSTMGRVSVWSLLMMTFADVMVFTSTTALSLSASRTYLPCLVAVFPCLMLAIIEVQFLSGVYKTQEPERRRSWQERQIISPQEQSNGTLPRPTTDPGPRRTQGGAAGTPVIIPLDQDVEAGSGRPEMNSSPNEFHDQPFGTLMGRCMFCSTVVLFLSIAATSWYPKARAVYSNIMLLCYLSFWVPQIYRNIMRNSRRALSWQYMIGQSVVRLIPIAYFYLYPSNIIFSRTDPISFVMLAGWVWVQLCILGFQDILGPRFGIPNSWTPEAWDYHPILREDSVEGGGLPIGLVSSLSPDSSPRIERMKSGGEFKSKINRVDQNDRVQVIDCAICCEDLEVKIIKAGENDAGASSVAGILARRQYMVTPCRHIFHSHCLENWMRFRLQCPICREELPPL